MVELKGSEKQVAWGNEIRENVMHYLNRAFKMLMEEIEEEGDEGDRTVEEIKQFQKDKFNKSCSEIINNDSAEYFIKHFRHIKKYGDSFLLAMELQELKINTILISYLQEREFDKYVFKDENLNYDTKNLKELKGTEKQVKWANEIRNRFLKVVEIFEEAKDNLNGSAYNDDIEDLKRNIRDILSVDRATFYIEKLSKLSDDMIEKSSKRTDKEKIKDTLVLTNSILGRY